MTIKRKVRLEMDWAWLRACTDLNAQEKRVLSVILAIALIGLVARQWWQVRVSSPNVQQPFAAEVAP